MSELSEIFNTSQNAPDIGQLTADAQRRQSDYWANLKATDPGTYEATKHLNPNYQREQAEAAAAAERAQALAAAQSSNPISAGPAPAPVPTYSGPSATEELLALLPGGFENTLLPSSIASPFISSTQSAGRSGAEGLIANMLRRGTATESGAAAGRQALGQQDPGVTKKLTDIGNVLLERGRSGLRGTAQGGFNAASGQTGEFFDPSPYHSQVTSQASQFQQGFPGSFAADVGDVSALYDTSGLGASTGGASGGGRGEPFDPYAVAGGKISGATGLEEGARPSQKKRSTAVF